jgi:hypothetical protein
MKRFKLTIILILILFVSDVFATSVNGRFIVVKSSKSSLSVLLQINTDSGKDDMGGATIVISFDKNVLAFSSEPVADKDYKFLNFSSGNYNNATVTKPLSDKLWINIDLPKENNNKGTVVSGSSGWTDVVTLNFDVKNPSDTAMVKWLQSNVFWQVYDADNTNSWSVGKFTNLVNAPVQVELLSFTAILLDNSNIQLDWSTISYADNYGYDIEKTDKDTISWQKIGFVESKNILNTPVNYSFIDNQVNSSSNLKYRLKSVNNDATYTILKEIEFLTSPETFELAQNYPNPFNPSTKINYTLPSNVNDQMSKVTLKVYDILGIEITTLVDELQAVGHHEVEFKADNLASGVYIYRIETPAFSATKKMILLR